MFLAVFFDEESRVAMNGHRTSQVQGITDVVWIKLRRYEKLTILGKIRLRVGRFSSRRRPRQWKERLNLHDIFEKYCHFSHSGGSRRIRLERFDVFGLARRPQEYAVHFPGGYYPQRTWGVFYPGLSRRFAPAITICTMGTRWDCVKARHVEACILGTLRSPRSERLAVVVSHGVGIQAVIRERRHYCARDCSIHG
jgi:hypothetical protein